MENAKIIKLYVEDLQSLRKISKIVGLTIHKVRTILIESGVEFRPNREYSRSDETKLKISLGNKKSYLSGDRVAWMTGKKWDIKTTLKQMKGHLKYDVSLDWLCRFEDTDKLKFISRSFLKAVGRSSRISEITTEEYITFIEKFYNDDRFNYLYNEWIRTGNRWIKPSLDHIKAQSNDGESDINNFKYISWLENRTKVDLDQDEWDKIKENINYYL